MDLKTLVALDFLFGDDGGPDRPKDDTDGWGCLSAIGCIVVPIIAALIFALFWVGIEKIISWYSSHPIIQKVLYPITFDAYHDLGSTLWHKIWITLLTFILISLLSFTILALLEEVIIKENISKAVGKPFFILFTVILGSYVIGAIARFIIYLMLWLPVLLHPEADNYEEFIRLANTQEVYFADERVEADINNQSNSIDIKSEDNEGIRDTVENQLHHDGYILFRHIPQEENAQKAEQSSTIHITVNEDYKAFKAKIGQAKLDDRNLVEQMRNPSNPGEDNSSATITILLDDNEIYHNSIKPNSDIENINVDLSDSKKLTIKTSFNKGKSSNIALFNPRFYLNKK
ncbi:NPCBM/NEW2 domain-containing protein [Pontibacillus yanchengensis]|nr:NPCBM/NEW2 domain-containing protein [Pontibacillus yanchengensis]